MTTGSRRIGWIARCEIVGVVAIAALASVGVCTAARASAQGRSLSIRLTWDVPTDLDLVVTDPTGFPVSAASHRADVNASPTSADGAVGETLEWPDAATGDYLLCAIGDAGAGAVVTLRVEHAGRSAMRTFSLAGRLGRPCVRSARGFLISLTIHPSQAGTSAPSEPAPTPPRETPVQAVPGLPDVVRLHDGGLFRGTIVERSEAQVTILLPTGVVRSFTPDAVAYAGVAGAAPASEPGAPPSEPPAPAAATRSEAAPTQPARAAPAAADGAFGTVSFRSRQERISAFIDGNHVCDVPCQVPLSTSEDRVGGEIAAAHDRGSGSFMSQNHAIVAQGSARLAPGATIDLHYVDNQLTRVMGWILGPALILPGLLMAYIGIDQSNIAISVPGLSLTVTGIVLFLALACVQDHVEMTEVSDAVRF